MTLVDQYNRAIEAPPVRTSRKRSSSKLIVAKLDSAQTTDNNSNHWANADSLSADAAYSSSVRKTTRERARYELANNCYAKGMVLSIANMLVGTGPRLQMSSSDPKLNSFIEKRFTEWSAAIRLPRKLKLMVRAKKGDGETFAMFRNNPKIDHKVTLDLQVIECDRVASSYLSLYDQNEVDGVFFDAFDNPISYNLLNDHPGTDKWSSNPLASSKIKADYMIHWFRQDRPEQRRGVSEIAPALPLFAQLRRYTLAVIAAAETAANFAGVLQSNAPAGTDPEDIEAMDVISLERNMVTTLPAGWQLGQLKAEQPTSTYSEFKQEIINEAARCLLQPYNVATGNSKDYNYASGRLDHQDFFKAVEVERTDFDLSVMDRIFGHFISEAKVAYDEVPRLDSWPHSWFYDGVPHVDPVKEASAQAKRLASRTTTLAREYAKEGLDWEEQIDQSIVEAKKLLELRKIEAEIKKLENPNA